MNETNYNLSSSKTYELKTTTKTTQNNQTTQGNKSTSKAEIMDFDSNVNEKAAVTIKEEELAKLEKEKEKLETQKKEIKSRITDEKWDVWELFFNNDKYNKDIDALEKKLKQIEKELKEVNNKITNLTTTGIERALQCELITSYDNEITKLEKEIKALETKIQEKQGELNRKRTAQSRARGLSSISDDDLDKIEKEIINLKEKVKQKKQEKTELKKVRKTTTNYITEIYYSNLKYNNDFENNIQINLTEEEAHQISQIYGTLYNTSFSYLVTTDKFYDFDEINKFYEENKDLFFEIDWEIVKKAYEKGFNIYEVAIKNPKLTEASINKEFSPTATFDGEYPLGTFAHIINYMTEEEKNNILYLYNTEGTEATNKYLTFKQQEINSRIGFVQASEFLEKVNNSSDVGAFLKTALKGTGDGIENFFEGLDNALGGMDGVMSASQFETMYIISWMSESDIDKLEGFTKEEKEKLKEIKGLNDSKFLQGTYEISSSIGNMIPSIAASTVVSIAATPVAGKVVGTALMGLSSGGNAAESMYQQGYGFYESIHYGMLSGSSEALLGYFLGGIPGLSKLDDLPGLKGYITNMLMEGGEESLQAIIDPYLQSVALGTEPEINWEEVKKSGIYGMITAGLLNGGKMVTAGGNISVDSISQETIDIIDHAENIGIEIDYSKIKEQSYIKKIKKETNSIIYSTEYKESQAISEFKETKPDLYSNETTVEDIMKKHPNEMRKIIIEQNQDIIYNAEELGIKIEQNKVNIEYVQELQMTIDSIEVEKINNYISSINNGLNSVNLTIDEVNSMFDGFINENIKYDMQKKFIDAISQKMQQGEQLSQSSYDAIFNSDMFAGDSEFAKNYLYDTIVDMGSPDLAQLVQDTYEGARKATGTKEMKNLHSYCDHTEAHVLQVAFLSMNSLNTLNQSITSGNNASGKYGAISEVDYKTILVSGLAHDLGMAAGVFDSNGNPINPAVNSWLEKDSNGKVELKSEIITSSTKKVADVVRGNHTLNSALAVLKNRTLFEQMGVNPDLVALLCFSHSKSNSGVVDLTSSPDWSFSIEKIQDAVNTYNEANPDSTIDFNTENLGAKTNQKVTTSQQKLIDKSTEVYKTTAFDFLDTFKQKLSTLGLSLRVGDAYVNKAKVILPEGQEVKWVYKGKNYSSNMLVLTQSGVYMAYDPNATVYFDNGTLNTVDTESSHYGAFMYFQKNEDGTFTPWNHKSTDTNPINYSTDINGAFIINGSNEECLMSTMGSSEVEVEVDGQKIKYNILNNGYYSMEIKKEDVNGNKIIVDKKYYDIKYDSKGNATVTEITKLDRRYSIASQGNKINSTTGQFLAGESNVTYEFDDYTINIDGEKTHYIKSTYKVGDIKLFPYNTIDKGIVERVGEIATAKGINRIADIVIEDSQFKQYFSIVDGEVVANSVKPGEINYGQIYIDHILATSTEEINKTIEFTINGYSISKY